MCQAWRVWLSAVVRVKGVAWFSFFAESIEELVTPKDDFLRYLEANY